MQTILPLNITSYIVRQTTLHSTRDARKAFHKASIPTRDTVRCLEIQQLHIHEHTSIIRKALESSKYEKELLHLPMHFEQIEYLSTRTSKQV